MNFKTPLSILGISIVLLCIVLVRGIERFDDTLIYQSVMQQIQGQTPIYQEEQYIHQVIPLLNNPGMMIVAVALGKIVGSDLGGLAAANAIFYVIAVLVFYNIALLVFEKHQHAFTATLFLAANYSLMRFGPGSYLTDMGGWLFYILALYFSVRFFKSQEARFAYLAGFVSMVGLFFKEYGGIGILTLGAFILLSPRSWKERILLLLKSGSFLLVNLGYHVGAYFTRGYLYLNRYQTVLRDFTPQQSFFRTLKVLAYVFNIGWPVAFQGFLYGWSRRLVEAADYKKIFLAMLPSALIFLAYPTYDQRIAFVAVPLLALMATFGLSGIKSKPVVYCILILYIVSNFYLMHKLSLPDSNSSF